MKSSGIDLVLTTNSKPFENKDPDYIKVLEYKY
jgi:hypothetical protein